MIIKNKTAYLLGFWAAVLTAIMILWFSIAFGLYQKILHAPWYDIKTYADSFKTGPFLVWVIPCFLLTICFLPMMTCLHLLTSEANKIWSQLAIVFALVYTTLLSALYYIQIVVVEFNLVQHSTNGLELWLFAHPYPHSIPGALEGVGYGFMSLSFISASKVFSGNKLSNWINRTFLFSGLTGLIVFTDPLFPLPLIVTLIIAFTNAILLFTGTILLSLWFRQSYNASKQNISLS